MKKTILTILALIITLSVAVAKHKKKHSKTKGKEIQSITMRHGGCFGTCPIYTVELDKDGMVTYTGQRFVKDSGTFKKNIGADKVQTLFDKFTAYRVDTCSSVYKNRITDVSSTYYTIVYKDKTQTIGNANFGPSYFYGLADNVNALATVDDSWQKTTK